MNFLAHPPHIANRPGIAPAEAILAPCRCIIDRRPGGAIALALAGTQPGGIASVVCASAHVDHVYETIRTCVEGAWRADADRSQTGPRGRWRKEGAGG